MRYVAIALAVAFAAHLPALWGAFIWDDQIIIRDQLPNIASLRDVLVTPPGIPNWSDSYYRPLVTATYLLDFRLLPGESLPALPHLSNLLFHLATVYGVWLLARRSLPAAGPAPALAAAALFGAHPIHVESVNWVSGRSDVLAAMFTVPAILCALRWRDARSGPALAGVAACVALGLAAKEVAIVALALVPLAWVLVPPGAQDARGPGGPGSPGSDTRGLLAAMGAAALGAALYFVLRDAGDTRYGEPLDVGPVVAILGLSRALAWYLVKLVLPWPQMNLVGWDELPGPLVAVAVIAAAGLLAGWSASRWRRGGDGLPLFAVAWIALALAPSLWVALSLGTHGPVAERYLYLPSVGLALGAAWLLSWVPTGRRALAGYAAVGVIAVAAAGAVVRGFAWTSDVRLWQDAVAKAPGNVFAWHSLARAWSREGDDGRALEAYERGLAAGDDPFQRPKILYAMAEIHRRRGEQDRAVALLARAEREAPDFTRTGYALGLIELLDAGSSPGDAADDGRRNAARRFRAALARSPRFPEARLALAQAMVAQAEALESAGAAGGAAFCYRRALAGISALQEEIAVPALAAYLRDAEAGLEKDVPAFRARVERALQRLREAGEPQFVALCAEPMDRG